MWLHVGNSNNDPRIIHKFKYKSDRKPMKKERSHVIQLYIIDLICLC